MYVYSGKVHAQEVPFLVWLYSDALALESTNSSLQQEVSLCIKSGTTPEQWPMFVRL